MTDRDEFDKIDAMLDEQKLDAPLCDDDRIMLLNNRLEVGAPEAQHIRTALGLPFSAPLGEVIAKIAGLEDELRDENDRLRALFRALGGEPKT